MYFSLGPKRRDPDCSGPRGHDHAARGLHGPGSTALLGGSDSSVEEDAIWRAPGRCDRGIVCSGAADGPSEPREHLDSTRDGTFAHTDLMSLWTGVGPACIRS